MPYTALRLPDSLALQLSMHRRAFWLEGKKPL